VTVRRANLADKRNLGCDLVSHASLVCVIDDEPLVRDVTCQMLSGGGFHTVGYASAEEFLGTFDEQTCACVVTDLRMPGIDGAELLLRLRKQGSIVAVVVLTGHADVRTAVKLMEDGALTLLEKPYEPPALIAAVTRAVQQTQQRWLARERVVAIHRRLQQLTEEERQVMECMIAELPTKAMAAKLVVSTRTVERRMLSVLRKMQVSGVAELAALMATLPPPAVPDAPEGQA
jgi:two-component system response regulator FixJ